MKYIKITTIALCFLMLFGCNQFLEVKPDKSLVVPATIKDLQALLDNTTIMNRAVPIMGEISADNYYVTREQWEAVSLPEQRNAYIWQEDIYESSAQVSNDWFMPYQLVTYANIALEGVEKLEPRSDALHDWSNIKGSALFFRAWAFYHLAQLFCRDYDAQTAGQDLGIPLRLESDAEVIVKRSSVEQTYQQIIVDLMEAVSFLPEIPLLKTRPSKVACYAMLARVYLQMRRYEEALYMSERCLSIQPNLMDFGSLDVSANYPIAIFNEEVLFHSNTLAAPILANTRMNIDTALYESYDHDDIRRQAFFWDNNGVNTFKGSYTGSSSFFGGLSVNEVYLINAEVNERLGNRGQALQSLNLLLKNRYLEGTQPDYSSDTDLLKIILVERRKELLFRAIRWSDVRRLNREQPFAKVLVRKLGLDAYELQPLSTRYTLPIPDMVLQINGIEQNDRRD